MEIFKMQTIMFSYFVSSVLVTIVMANVWIQNRKKFKGTSHWFIFYVLQTVGILCIMLRGWMPDIISKVFANSLIICSLMFFLVGLQRFIERKAEYLLNVIFLLIFTYLYYYYGIVNPSYKIRAVIFSSVIILLLMQSVYLLIFKTEKSSRKIYISTAIVCFFLTLLYGLRMILALFAFSEESEFYTSGTQDALVMLASQMLGIMMTFSLVLMINRRLFIDVNHFAEEREMMVNELRRLASTDGLTGIYNRSKIEQILTIEVLRSRRYKHKLSIILGDIDHFKEVNDSFGHNVGDTVLTGVASLLKQHIREVDSIGRWGGEEFLIICPETTADGAGKLAEKLRAIIEQHNFRDVGFKTISMGIAVIEGDEWDDDLIKRADKNLYKAKQGGRNMVV